MRFRRLIPILFTVGAIALILPAAQKKKKDEITQTLALPKEPPAVAAGETRRLVFHVTPLSAKGPLAQQTRYALHALLKLNGGVPVVHLRAYVAGGGDVRRVPQLVSEVFTEKKLPLPSVSVVRAGAFALEGAQVAFEAVSVAKRDVNSTGLGFHASDPITASDPLSPAKPMMLKALDQLAVRMGNETPLSATCFVSLMQDGADLSATLAARFSGAATLVVQTQRAPYQGFALCEATTRGGTVSAEHLAFTGTRVAFGAEEKDATLAFQRHDRDLAEADAPPSGIVISHLYYISPAVAELTRKLRTGTAPMLAIPFEGLASLDAGFAVDSIAVAAR